MGHLWFTSTNPRWIKSRYRLKRFTPFWGTTLQFACGLGLFALESSPIYLNAYFYLFCFGFLYFLQHNAKKSIFSLITIVIASKYTLLSTHSWHLLLIWITLSLVFFFGETKRIFLSLLASLFSTAFLGLWYQTDPKSDPFYLELFMFFEALLLILSFTWQYVQEKTENKINQLERLFLQSHCGYILFDGLCRPTKWNQKALDILEIDPKHLNSKEPISEGWVLVDTQSNLLSETTHPLDAMFLEKKSRPPSMYRLFSPQSRTSKWIECAGHYTPSKNPRDTVFLLSIQDLTQQVDQRIYGENQRSFFHSLVDHAANPTYRQSLVKCNISH